MNDDFSLVLAGMRDTFVGDLPDRCDLLEDCVLMFGQGDEDTFDELFRHIHSLKGAGGTFGLPVITRICHQFESFVSIARGNFDRGCVLSWE